MDKFEGIETSQHNSMKPLDALEDLIECIQTKREQTKCQNHRIVMFCGKYGPTSKLEKSLKLELLSAKLKKMISF